MSDTSTYQTFLETTSTGQRDSMAAHTFAGEKVWLKRAAKRNSCLAYAPLNWLARLLKVEALKPVPNLGGEQSIRTEVARLETLGAAGIKVPELLAHSPRALLLADAGTPVAPAATLLDRLKAATHGSDVDRLIGLGVAALIDVHRRECYLSEAFARNILLVDDEVVFIDFETDPGSVHTIVDCMVRDWYCLIFSLYGKLSKSLLLRERLTPVLVAALHRERADVRERFTALLPPLLRLKAVPFKRLGSDGRKIHQTLDALAALHEQLT